MQNRKLELYSRELWSLCRSLDGLALKKLKQLIKKKGSKVSFLWINLFTQLRLLRKYSKTSLREKLGKPDSKEIRIAERILLKNIRIALHIKSLPSPRSRIYMLLKAAEEFYLRGFPQLAHREITRANKICIDFEMLEEQHAVLEWALKISLDLENWSEVEQVLSLNTSLIQKSSELHGFKQLMFDYWQMEVSARPKLERAFKVTENPGFSIRAKLHNLLLVGAGFIGDHSEFTKQNALENAIELLENHPNIQLSNPTLSIEIFRRWSEFCLENGFFERHFEWLQKIETVRFLSPSQNIRLAELWLLWKLQFDLKSKNEAQHDSATKVLDTLKVKKRALWTRRHHEMALALSQYYLGLNAFKDVLQLLSQLMESAKITSIGKRYLLEAKQLEIELHQSMGNFELVQNKILNLKKIKLGNT
jgi:hypothetical protein